MKKLVVVLLTLTFVLGMALPLTAMAAGESFELYYTFDKEYYEIGDTVTVQMHLDRKDSADDYTIYSFECGSLFAPLNLEYIDSSASTNNAKGFRVGAAASYYNENFKSISIIYHSMGTTSPISRTSSLILAELKFTAKAGIRSAAMLFYSPNLRVGSTGTTAGLTTVNGTYTIGNPAAPTFAVLFAAGADTVDGTTPVMDEKAEGDLILLPTCPWTREGYTFAGWSNGKRDYAAGDTYTMPAAAVTFTAQWTRDPVKRTITFTAGKPGEGQSAVGEPPASRELFPDETLSLPTQNTLAAPGYSFEGWGIDDEIYKPGDTYVVPDEDVNFSALWRSIETGVVSQPEPGAVTKNPFNDVNKKDWFYNDVLLAYKNGLIKGMTSTTYVPGANLKISEAVKLAACLYQLATEGEVTLTEGETVWYQPYVDYALKNGIIAKEYSDYNAAATRAQFAEIFAKALPAEKLQDKNTVPDGSIPDIAMTNASAAAIYKLYRAGITWGVDSEYNYSPDALIKRSEAAAILTRMHISDERLTFTTAQ